MLQKAFWNGRIFGIYPVDDFLINDKRIWGPYINRNHFAGYLELAIPLCLGMLLYVTPTSHSLPGVPWYARFIRIQSSSNISSQATFFLLLLVMTAGLTASLSRGGMMASAISFCLFVWITRKRRMLKSRSLLLIAVAVILASVVLFASWDTLEERFEELDTGHVGRLNTWIDSQGMLRDYPLTGSGLGTFETGFRRYQTKETGGIYDHAHNDYVELLTDCGFAGFSLVSALVALFCATLYRRWRQRRSRYASCMGAGGLCSCGAMAVHSFTDFNLHIPANALLLTVILALTWALLFNVSSRHETEPGPASLLRPASPLRRFALVGLLLLLAPPICLAMTSLWADRNHASIERILDDRRTEELDQIPLLPETVPRYLAALREAQAAHALEPSRASYSWSVAELATRLGRWAAVMEQVGSPLPAGMPSSNQAFGIARNQLRLAIKAEPTNPDFHLAFAELLRERYDDQPGARAELGRALDCFPHSGAVRLAVARQLLLAGKRGEALEQLRMAARVDDSYLLPDSPRKAGTLESRPGWYMDRLYRSNLYATLELAWLITRSPRVVRGLVPTPPEARIVLEAFIDQECME